MDEVRGDAKRNGPGALTRERVESAIAKILKDQGLDVGKDVQRVKQVLLQDREFERSPFAPKTDADWQALMTAATEQPTAEPTSTPTSDHEVQTKPEREEREAKTVAPGQQEIPVPPPTIGERPIIGREPTPEEAPLFSKAAQEPEAEQAELPRLSAVDPAKLTFAKKGSVVGFDRQGNTITMAYLRPSKSYTVEVVTPSGTIVSSKRFGTELEARAEAASKIDVEQTRALAWWDVTGLLGPVKKEPQPSSLDSASVNQKAPWEMTALEYSQSRVPASLRDKITSPQQSFEAQHRKEIQAALKNGEDVPAEVLADYPDLQPQVKATAEPPAPQSPTEILAQALRGAADQIEGKPSESASLSDVGSKIGGARKDLWASRGLTIDDLAEMSGGEEAKYVTKANIWKPDYSAMVKEGADPKAVALVKIMYDRLAAKPKADTAESRRQYVTMMGYVKDAYASVKTLDDVKQARQSLLTHATDENSRGLSPVYASVFKDRAEPFYMDVAAQRRAAKMVAEGFPNQEPWTRRYSITNYGGPGLTKEGAEYYDKKGGTWAVVEKSSTRILSYKPDETSAKAEAQRLYAERSADTDEGRVPERPHLDDLKRSGEDSRAGKNVTAEDFRQTYGFRGVEFGNYAASDERQKHVNQAYDALMDLANLLGIPPKAISLNGTLGLAFGARGGGKAIAHYEPSKLVINITKVNGPGALAHEWGHALDHYFGELDRPDAYTGSPKGASGWRQLEKYTGMPERRPTFKDGKKYGTESSYRLAHLRPEMAVAFDRVMDALFNRSRTQAEAVREVELNLETLQGLIAKYEQEIQQSKEKAATPPDKTAVSWLKQAEEYLKTLRVRREVAGKILTELTSGKKPDGGYGRVETSFYKQAQTLSGPTGDYWKRPTEMFARSFEAYVFDRLGSDSDYLVHGVEADRYTKEQGYKGNPYPTGAEREAINTAFNHLFDVMETKETEQGTALFQRSDDAGWQETLRDLGRLETTMRRVRGSEQAKFVRSKIIGKPLTNRETGLTATVSGESFSKMLSKSAVNRSITPQAHMQALGNLDLLFPLATLEYRRVGKKADDERHLETVHRFTVPMPFDGDVLRVDILAKQFVDEQQGTRLYLVEAVEIVTPASLGTQSVEGGSASSPTVPPRPAGVSDRFAQMMAAVKGGGSGCR